MIVASRLQREFARVRARAAGQRNGGWFDDFEAPPRPGRPARARQRGRFALVAAALVAAAPIGAMAAATPAWAAEPPAVTAVEPSTGPAAGGTSVTITGTNFTNADAVRFGSSNAASFTVNSQTSITATSPALAPDTNARVAITVTTPAGTSAVTNSGDKFFYEPEVTRVSPRSGGPGGGTSVVIEGRGLKAAAVVEGEVPPPNCGFTNWVCQVRFGTTPATGYEVRELPPFLHGEPEIVAVAPPGTGTVDVRLTTGAGTSPITPADQFSYVPAPTVTGLEPHVGPAAGGTPVTITGANFTNVQAVKFGSTSATSFTVNSESSITAVAPAGTGAVDVTVTTPSGTSPTGSADQFTYGPTVTTVEPNVGQAAGGTPVTITGTGFKGVSSVKFGSTGATAFTVNSETSITAIAPAGTGAVDITVSTPAGTSPATAADEFTYGPTVSKLEPNSGPTKGATKVTITGSGFAGATAVTFGSSNATSFTVNSSTSITAVSPRGTGIVNVAVTTPAGSSPTSSADQFTYKNKKT